MPEDSQTVTKKQLVLWTIPPEWTGVSGGISDTSDGILAWGRASVNEVASKRVKWAEKIDIDHSLAITLEQVHDSRVVRVGREHGGAGFIDSATRIAQSDGSITNDPLVTLVTSHADCAPIFLYHPGARAIGLIHAGWRGALSGIASIAIGEMSREFLLKPEEIQVSVGPMIATLNYEVGEDVAAQFISKFGPSTIVKYGDTPHLDVFACIIVDLMRAGVATARFCPRPPDTYSNLRWSSYRRDGERAGGMLAYFKIS